MGLTDMYVIDNYTRRIHKIGDDRHDSIWVDCECEVQYMNLQNGDGGDARINSQYGYTILMSDCGSLEDEYGIIDKRFEKEIKEFLSKPKIIENGGVIGRANVQTEEDLRELHGEVQSE